MDCRQAAAVLSAKIRPTASNRVVRCRSVEPSWFSGDGGDSATNDGGYGSSKAGATSIVRVMSRVDVTTDALGVVAVLNLVAGGPLRAPTSRCTAETGGREKRFCHCDEGGSASMLITVSFT